ncbi:MAG: hypothetical protein K0Q73_5811 [Paenibacillus sp.]|jgi:hypothetical protein|nr:hypothetical protein [Paenibacillus sp.]
MPATKFGYLKGWYSDIYISVKGDNAMSKKISREQFERAFQQMNGSWAYEDADLSLEEKELLYKRMNGEITDEEYNRAFIERKGKGE